jgi:hypothetical protein
LFFYKETLAKFRMPITTKQSEVITKKDRCLKQDQRTTALKENSKKQNKDTKTQT